MNIQKCIYCPSSGPFSEEHALPRSLGEFRGFPPLINRVCAKCNGYIGRLEEQFGRSGPEAFFRKYLNIEGRDTHDEVNLFQRGSAGAKPIDFTALHPETGIEVLWEFNPGEKTVREARQIVFIDDKGRSHLLRIPKWMNNTDQLRAEMKKTGLDPKGKLSARVFASDDEMEWVENLARGLGSEFMWLPPKPSAKISNPVATVHVTDSYFRAIAKIGFHYLLSVVSTFRGNEYCFAAIRRFIKDGGTIEDFVTQTKRQILAFPHPNIRPKGWGHVLLVENAGGQVQAQLQFFLSPEYNPPTYLVRLSKDAVSIGKTGWKGHYFSYFKSGRKGKYQGQVSELNCFRLQ